MTTELTEEQRYKLNKVIELVNDSLDEREYNFKIISVWLSVAGDYCEEVAKEIME